MKPLTILLSVFFVGLLTRTFLNKEYLEIRYLARIAMSCMLVFTGISHFIFADGMSKMLPLDNKLSEPIIYLTGVFEVLAGVLLVNKKLFKKVGVVLIVFLILALPSNIYSALNNIDTITGSNDGPGISYLWFRIPLQLFFIGWVFFSTRKK